jgi:hypothetical protein
MVAGRRRLAVWGRRGAVGRRLFFTEEVIEIMFCRSKTLKLAAAALILFGLVAPAPAIQDKKEKTAANYTPEEVRLLSGAVRARINELAGVGGPTAAR